MAHDRQAIGGVGIGSAEPLFPAAIKHGELLFLSGQAPIDPLTLAVCAPDFASQAAFVMERIAETLAAAGSGPQHVLRVECILASAGDFGAWNEVFSRAFAPPRPARTTIVAAFVVPDMLLEVQVTAAC